MSLRKKMMKMMEEDLKLKKVAKDDDTKPMTTVDVRFDGYVTVTVPWSDYESIDLGALNNKEIKKAVYDAVIEEIKSSENLIGDVSLDINEIRHNRS